MNHTVSTSWLTPCQAVKPCGSLRSNHVEAENPLLILHWFSGLDFPKACNIFIHLWLSVLRRIYKKYHAESFRLKPKITRAMQWNVALSNVTWCHMWLMDTVYTVGEFLSYFQVCCGCVIFYCVWSKLRHVLETFNLVVGSQISSQIRWKHESIQKNFTFLNFRGTWPLF